MNNCVFFAYADALKYYHVPYNSKDLGFKIYLKEWQTYKRLKIIGQGDVQRMTVAPLIPWIIQRLASKNGFRIKIQARIVTPDHLFAASENYIQKFAVWRMYDKIIVVDELTLAPAIYLLLNENHATFATSVPIIGFPVMAIQLIKKI